MSRWCDSDDGPSNAAISHGLTGTGLGTNEMGEAGIISIHLAYNTVQPWEGEYYCKCSPKELPWSKGGTRSRRNGDDTISVFSSARSRAAVMDISIGGRPKFNGCGKAVEGRPSLWRPTSDPSRVIIHAAGRSTKTSGAHIIETTDSEGMP